MYERIFDKITQDVINEVESRIPLIMDDYDDLTHSQAEDRACEAILDQADDMGLYFMFEYILKKSGYWGRIHKDNPYLAFEPKKSEAQSSFEAMMGVSDLSNLLKVRG